MKDFVHVGTNSYIAVDDIETVSPPESAPIKRLVSTAKDEDRCVELTYGRRTKSVITLQSGKIVLSSTLPQTIIQRIAEKKCD